MTLVSSDEPITTQKEDRLGRGSFATHLAQRIAAYDNPDPLVIALHGPWGSGKTSLLNLIQECLKTPIVQQGKPPIVIRFDPWNFHSVDQLIAMFFREIRLAIKQGEPGKASKKIGKSLEVFATALSWAELLPSVGVISKISKPLADMGRLLRKEDRSLEQIRNDINKGLLELQQRIVIMIDDIDRLETDHILAMLRLIRLNADLPYVTYVLAFDRTVVETALHKAEHAITGKDYLDKIVQVGLDIPAITLAHLHKMFFEKLNTVIGPIPEDDWNTTRWQEMFIESLQHFLLTPRDIVRYVNGLRITLPLVGSEVNVVDFVGLEAIRTFQPKLYTHVANNPDVFIHTQNSYLLDERPEFVAKTRSDIETLVGQPAALRNNPWAKLLVQLFPKVSGLLGGPNYSAPSFTPLWRKERRICTTEYFDTYFRLQTPPGTLSELQLHGFVQTCSSYNELVSKLKELTTQKHVKQLDRYISDHEDELNPEPIENLIKAIFVLGDVFETESAGMSELSDQRHMVSLTAGLFRRIQEHEKCRDILNAVVQPPFSLSLGVSFVATLEHASDRANYLNPSGQPVFSPETEERARHVLLDRIRAAAGNEILSLPDPLDLIFRWRDWAGANGTQEVSTYLGAQAKTDRGLLGVLVAFMSEVKSSEGSYGIRRTRYVSKDYLGQFLDLQSISGRIENLKDSAPHDLSETERQAIETFLNPPREARM